MTGNAVYQAFARARKRIGVDISFHAFRHTGQSLAAAAGASLADLKKRLGHPSSAAAQRYLHTVEGWDTQIPAALSDLARAGMPHSFPGDCDAAPVANPGKTRDSWGHERS